MKKKKKTSKSHFFKDNLIKEKELLKDIKDKIKNKDINEKRNNNGKYKEKEKAQEKQTINKIKKNKLRFSKSLRHPPFEQNLNLLEGMENKMKTKPKTDKKNSKNKKSISKKNSNNNFEDKNLISHSIEENKEKEEFQNENNPILIKSSKYNSQRQYFLIKEIDRDEKKHTTEVKSNKRSLKSSRKKDKLSKKHNTEKFKLQNEYIEKKYTKEITLFNPLNEESNKKQSKRSNKFFSMNIFRKSHNKYNESKNDEKQIYKTKISNKYSIHFDQNKEKDKLRSSLSLHGNSLNTKNIENIKERSL